MTKARDVMTPNPKTVHEGDSLQQVARLMKEMDAGVVPVTDTGNKIIGLVTDRDIVVRVVADGKNPADVNVSNVMSRDLHCVREDDSIDDVHRLMRDHQVRRIPVVNERDEIVGIVAQADIATRTGKDKKLGQTVEEISR